MASEDAFNATVGAFSMYGALLKDVAAEIGMDRALEFHARQGTNFGSMLNGLIKARLGDNDLNVETLTTVMAEVGQGFGMSPEIKHTPTGVSFKHHHCPIYEGFRAAGWAHDDIKATCECMAGSEVAALQEAFPKLSGSVVFRPTPKEPCLEEFTIKA